MMSNNVIRSRSAIGWNQLIDRFLSMIPIPVFWMICLLIEVYSELQPVKLCNKDPHDIPHYATLLVVI